MENVHAKVQSSFDKTLNLIVPEGDTTAPAEFRTCNILTLTAAPEDGKSNSGKKIGRIPNDPGKTLGQTESAIGNFLRGEEVGLIQINTM